MSDSLSSVLDIPSESVSAADDDKSILQWDGNKWGYIYQGSRKIVEFVFTYEPVDDKKELPEVSLKWNTKELEMHFQNQDIEKVKRIEINKSNRKITITSNSEYSGPIKQLLEIQNTVSGKTENKPTCILLFDFIKKMSIEDETIQENENDEPRPRKRPGIKKSNPPARPTKVQRMTISQLEKDTISNLNHRITKNIPSDPEIRFLPLDLLRNDFVVRTAANSDVDIILQEIKNGKWNDNLNPLIVNKTSDSELYFVLNGNIRLLAIKKFNEEASENQRPILTVKCVIYKDLNFDQKLLIVSQSANQTPEFPVTILQQTKIVLQIVDNHKIAKPTTKSEIQKFNILMETYFCQKYNSVCTDLIRLPNETLNSIFKINIQGDPIEHSKLSPKFWKIFTVAAKNDPLAALEVLPKIETENIGTVEKLLTKIKINLLEYLRKCGSHEFKSDEDAIEYLTEGKQICKEDLMRALKSINFLKNSGRNSSNWEGLKSKIASYFQKNLIYKNATFVETIDETLLSSQNFIITQEFTISLKNLFAKYQKNFDLLIFDIAGEVPSVLPDIEPTATFTIILEEPVIIDKLFEHLPQTSTKAYLYLSNAPQTNEKEKTKFLSQRALNKSCRLADTFTFQHCHEIAKLSTNCESILLHNTSLKLTQHFLSQLTYYRKIFVSGNEEHKRLVATCISTENNGEDIDESFEQE